MSVDASSPVKSAPRISRDTFVAVLNDAGSPWAALAGSLYNLIVGKGHDPAFWLAIAGREHTYGTNHDSVLWRNNTNSWTNARTVRDPEVAKRATIITDPMRHSEYVKYQTVADSLLDGMYRLDDPTYVYQQQHAVSIGAVIALWTEAEATEYTAFVVDKINEWSAAVVDISGFVPPTIVQQWFPVNGKSYMGEDMDMWGVCVHQTGNTDPGAEAQQNVTYMNSVACIKRQASWHSTVGLDTIIETIPQTKQAYHASDGDGPGNTHFKAVEHVVCYKVGTPEYHRVMLNGAWYTAKSLKDAGKPATADTIKQHHDFARDGKDCPMQFRDNHEWPEYVAYVQAFYAQMTNAPAPDPAAPVAVPPTIPDPWKSPVRPNTWIARQFVSAIEHEGFMRAGYVVSEGFEESGLYVQYFERARLELDAAGAVTWGLIGKELLAAKYPNRRAA